MRKTTTFAGITFTDETNALSGDAMMNYSLSYQANGTSESEATVSADFQIIEFFGKPYLYLISAVSVSGIYEEELASELVLIESASRAADYGSTHLISAFGWFLKNDMAIDQDDIAEKAMTFRIHIERAVWQQFSNIPE